MKILITGIGGFIGNYLAEFLLDKNVEIYGTYYKPTVGIENLDKKIKLFECDIRNKNKFKKIINEVKPDKIFHLAAQSYPALSWKKVNYTLEVNIIGTANLLQSVKELKLDPIILVACSSGEYGFVDGNKIPLKEEYNLKPLHPYGVSKVAAELLSYQYYKNFNIKTIAVRIVNTTGPSKVNDVCSDFTKKLVLIEKGKANGVMKVGNLETSRAITDVRDMVEALWLATEKGKYGEVYNISSSKAYKIEEILNKLLELTDLKVKIKQSSKLIRPSEEQLIIGDSSKFKRDTNWEEKIPIDQTLQDMLNYWRKVL